MILSRKKLYAILFFLSLFILAALRPFSVGTDTISYVKGYINPIFSIQNRNVGYNTFVNILRLISENPRFFLIIMSFVIQFFVFKSIEKFSKYPVFAFIVYSLVFFCLSLNILRQFIVIGLFYSYGIEFIIERKFFKYFLLIILLTTLHELSLTLLPLYFFSKKSLPKMAYIIVWVVSFVFLISNQLSGIGAVFQSLDTFLRLFLSNLPYYLTEIDTLTNNSVSLNGVFLDQVIFLILAYLLFFKNKEENETVNIVFFNVYFLGIVFQNLFIYIDVIQRIATLFLFSSVVLISNVVVDLRMKFLLIVVFIAIFYVRFVLNGIAGVF